MSCIHRFGASLNRHVHYDENRPGSRASRAVAGAQIRSRRIGHCGIIDGVFEPVGEADDGPQAVRFRAAAELTPQAVTAITDQVRIRVLRWFARSGLIERDDVREMRALRAPPGPTAASRWMPRRASVRRIAPAPFRNRERLLRYCARPPFALERLERLDAERVVYRLPACSQSGQRDGTTALTLTPLELIDHRAALIPPPRRHRHRYHGVLAPNAPLRAAAIAFGREVAEATDSPTEVRSPPPTPASNARSPARYLWVMLLARLFESLPLTCPNCGADMRLIAFITEAAPVERILTHIGEPPRPPPITPARPGAALSCSAWVPAQTILVR
ncbi:MAG: transposase [Thiohalocapsa sp.]